MRLLAVTLAALLLAGCSTAPRMARLPGARWERTGSSFPALQHDIDGLLADSLFPPSNASVKIVSLSTGETLYEREPRLAFTPASNQKLFTAAAALAVLQPAYPFVTRLFADTSSVPTLFLQGSGDPLLTTSDLDSLVAAALPSLPPGRTWVVAGDARLFDDVDRGKGWAWDDEPDPTVPFLSPLSLNGNTIRVLVRPGRTVGDSVRVMTEPRTSFVRIENAGRTLPDTSFPTLDISRKWREFSNTITITGGVGIGDTVISTKLSIAQPAWYTLTVLREAFEASGVKIGRVMIDSVSARAREVARCSHRLDSVLVYMDRTSDNLAAENVLRTLAVHRQGAPGTASGGIAVVREFLAGIGIDTTKTVIADGSGVSRYNLTNAESIVDLLVALSKRPDLFPLWRETFPIAGVSGTLARRMKNTPAAGNLRGKTGTLNGVSSLSGYVTTADGDMLAYAIIMEQFPGSPQPYRRVQDLLGALLAGWRR